MALMCKCVCLCACIFAQTGWGAEGLQHISLSIFTHVRGVQWNLATSASLSYFLPINYGLLYP